jgi:hypothetical protein
MYDAQDSITVAPQWQTGDRMLLDNMCAYHGGRVPGWGAGMQGRLRPSWGNSRKCSCQTIAELNVNILTIQSARNDHAILNPKSIQSLPNGRVLKRFGRRDLRRWPRTWRPHRCRPSQDRRFRPSRHYSLRFLPHGLCGRRKTAPHSNSRPSAVGKTTQILVKVADLDFLQGTCNSALPALGLPDVSKT